jgi:hypothetical protein
MSTMCTNQDLSDGQPRPGVLVGGVLLIAIGGLLLLDTSGLFDVPVGRLIAPTVLITLGTLMMAGKGGVVAGYRERDEDGRRARARMHGGMVGGLWLIGTGIWMLLSQTHAFGLDFHNSWPLFIILSGLIMLVKAFR